VKKKAYRPPWNLYLAVQPWRTGEIGEVCAAAAPNDDQWQGNQVAFDVPLCAAMTPTFIEATRAKEVQTMLKFGRDSNWPLKATIASAICENVSASITYSISWEGCNSTEAWFRTKRQRQMGCQTYQL
jgi:hypothetical protein